MRQIVLAIAGYFLLQLFVPRLWEKLMNEGPPWLARLVVFAVALACVVVVVFAPPVWARLSNPSQYPFASTIIVIALMAAIGATAWWQFVVSDGTKTAENTGSPSASAAPTPEPTTLENVDSKVKEWVAALPDFLKGAKTEDAHGNDVRFAYKVIFSDGLVVVVSRNKDRWGRFITLGASISLEGDYLDHYSQLPEDQKHRFIQELSIEISKAKIPCGNIDPSEPIMIAKRIPIDSVLTT